MWDNHQVAKNLEDKLKRSELKVNSGVMSKQMTPRHKGKDPSKN
jgi:hypothetical protein